MRIIGGSHRGRRLSVPTGRDVRPTADRAREGVFNILVNGLGVQFGKISVVDLFAGTGALGLEALSRGAPHAVFVDNSKTALSAIRTNIETFGFDDRSLIMKTDATRLPALPTSAMPAGLIFLDPPYNQGLLLPGMQCLQEKSWLASTCICVLERRRDEAEITVSGFGLVESRTYGEAAFQFLRAL